MKTLSKGLARRLVSFFLTLLTCLSLVGCAGSSGQMEAQATAVDPALDFSSCRLVLVAEEEMLRPEDTVLGSYGSIHLLSFETEEEAKDAYLYYKDQAAAVEPDRVIQAAKETDDKIPDVIPMDETDNPIMLLQELKPSEEVQEEHGVIALIDTGVSEQDHVIDRISVIDDQVEGKNGHGDQMVSAILSQDNEAQILSIRALDDQGFGTVSSLVAAMEYAIEQEADFINLSLYARTTLSTSVLEQEILKAIDAGIPVIGAAGNDGADAADYLPGAVDEAYIIGAANADGPRLESSNYGKTVDYNVVAGSTSEAAALFTGFLSAHGTEAVEKVLNQGLIYETDDPEDAKTDEDTITAEAKEETETEEPAVTDEVSETEQNTETGKTDGVGELVETEEAGKTKVPDDEITAVLNGTYDLDMVDTYSIAGEKYTEEETARLLLEYRRSAAANSLALARETSWASVKPGTDHAYGSWNTCEFEIDRDGVISQGYCAEPNSDTPDGTFQAYELNNDDIKAILLFAPGGPNFDQSWWDAFGNNPATGGGDGHNDPYSLAHACIGYAYSGETTGLSDTDVEEIRAYIQMFKDECAKPWVQEMWDQYTAYIAYNDAQDVVWLEHNPDIYTTITVSKNWSDYNNEFGVRPGSITVNLYQSTSTPIDTSGTPYSTCTLNASNNWRYTWTDLIKESGDTSYNYAIREQSVPNHYTASYTGWSGSTESGYSATITNTLNVGYLRLHKDSSLPNVTDDNRCYTLAGAEYTVYNSYANGQLSDPVGVLTTDANGDTDTMRLLRKTYYIKETKAAPHYQMDNRVYTVTITAGHTESAPYQLNVTDVPGNDPTGISITKIWDGAETATIPTLEGTQFTIKYFDDMDMTLQEAATATPKRTWVLEVKYVESVDMYITGLTDTYLVDDLSDEFYRDAAGQPILPYGTITIQETKAAAGYTLDGYLKTPNGTVVSRDSALYMTTVDGDNGMPQLQGGNEFQGFNTPVVGSISLTKFDTDGRTPLSGVTFQCVGETGKDVQTVTTDRNGKVSFNNLYPDVYTITEVSTVDGHELLAEPLTVEVPMRVTDEYIEEFDVKVDSTIYDPADDIYYIHNFTYEITNGASLEMPMAGGFENFKIFLPLVAGLGLMGGTGILILRKRP